MTFFKALDDLAAAIGDCLYIARVCMAEDIVWLALVLMPDGPEKRKMEGHMHQYVKWLDQ